MAKAITLNICHLYPDLMDTYGDKGNIIAIQKRCSWRGIKTSVTETSIGDKLDPKKFDIYFFGGGQDKTQKIVSADLQSKKTHLKNAVEGNAVLLSICGGYQLLQKYFKTKEDKIINGIGLFNAYTIGSNERMIQNLWIDLEKNLKDEIKEIYQTTDNKLPRAKSPRFSPIITFGSSFSSELSRKYVFPSLHSRIKNPRFSRSKNKQLTTDLIGFENHSGKTFLEKKVKPLGKVLKGSGNNGEDKTEGAIYKNAFGCYLHGSLLPKNPHFADLLISKALEKRYGKITLKPLDDHIEWQAHNNAINRTTRRKD